MTVTSLTKESKVVICGLGVKGRHKRAWEGKEKIKLGKTSPPHSLKGQRRPQIT
jgi:hypothetical protein